MLLARRQRKQIAVEEKGLENNAGIHAGQGLAPRAPAVLYDFDPAERPFFGYSKPSPRD